jgi:hypothetical protein
MTTITRFREVHLRREDGRGVTLYECQTCAAVVTRRHQHEAWHRQLGELLARATSRAEPVLPRDPFAGVAPSMTGSPHPGTR